jgi:hypothetical protein
VQNVVHYIDNQEEHHKKKTFQEEFEEILKIAVLNMIRNIYGMMMNRYIALSGLGNFSHIVTQGFVRRGGLHPGLWVHCPSRTVATR